MWPSDGIWGHRFESTWVHFVAWRHQAITWTTVDYTWYSVAFTWGQFHRKYSTYLCLKWIWQLLMQDLSGTLKWTFHRTHQNPQLHKNIQLISKQKILLLRGHQRSWGVRKLSMQWGLQPHPFNARQDINRHVVSFTDINYIRSVAPFTNMV